MACSVSQDPSGTDENAGTDPGSSFTAGGGEEGIANTASARTDSATEFATKVVVHYPLNGKTMSLVVDGAMPMNMENQTADAITFRVPNQNMTFTPALNGTKALGPSYRVTAGQTIDVYPRFFTTKGKAFQKTWDHTTSKLPSSRGIYVYTPPSYEENPTARYPVIYMHDGSGLWDTNTVAGGDMRIDEFLDAGAADGTIREAIVVGIGSNENRYNEMTPPRTRSTGSDGLGDKYLEMITQEIKPMIDQTYRTLPDRDNTGVMGASLGGLMSMEAALLHGDTFGIVGAQSPSAWYDANILADQVKAWSTERKPNKVYIDCGDTTDMQADISQVAQRMKDAGFVEGQNLKFVVDPSGKHEVASWTRRLPAALAFMLGSR